MSYKSLKLKKINEMFHVKHVLEINKKIVMKILIKNIENYNKILSSRMDIHTN